MKKGNSFFRNLITEDNKGYTLVELIVAVAIFAMVSIAIVGFINITTKTYKTDTTEVNLQYEAQQTVNQIKELIVDTNRGVNFVNDGSETALYIYNETETVDASGVSVMEFPVIKVVYDSANQELQYVYKTFPSPDAINAPNAFDDASVGLLGQFVTGFDVDLSNVSKDEVKLDISFESSDREYSTTPTVAMRNKIIVSDSVRDIYTGTAVQRASYILGVEIYQNGHKVDDVFDINHTGSVQTIKFDAIIDAIGIHDEARWTLTGGSGSTVSEDGTVSISPADKGKSLTLIAFSKADSNKKASISLVISGYDVTRAYVTSLSLTGEGEGGEAPHEGVIASGSRTYYYVAHVSYTDEAKVAPTDKGVTWSMEPATVEGVTFDTVSGTATCDYTASGKIFTIIARTKLTDTEGEYREERRSVTVAAMTRPEDRVTEVPTIEWGGDLVSRTTLDRNDSYTITAKANSANITKYEWKIDYISGFNADSFHLDWGGWKGSNLDNPDLVTIKKSETGVSGSYYSENASKAALTVSKDLDWKKVFQVKVTVTVSYKEKSTDATVKTVSESRDYTINKVGMVISQNKSDIKYNSYDRRSPVKLTLTLSGLKLLDGDELEQKCILYKNSGETKEDYDSFKVDDRPNDDGTYNLYLQVPYVSGNNGNGNGNGNNSNRYTYGTVYLFYEIRYYHGFGTTYEQNRVQSNQITVNVKY